MLDELDKFRAVLLSVLTTGREVMIACGDDGEAKSLRRRMYSLRDKLIAFEREAADSVAFSLAGRRVRCTPKPQVRLGDDWTHRITIGAPINDASSKGDVPQVDRLDESRGPSKL
jgi:hypothetical protein